MDRAQALAHALLLTACAWLPACGLNEEGVGPRADTIAYPASAIMDGRREWLFVTNSNADLRYNDGTLMALSLTRAESDRRAVASDPANTPGDCKAVDYTNPLSDPFQDLVQRCCRDLLDRNIINCDERAYVGGLDADVGNGGGNVRIGSFAAGMVLQQPKCPTLDTGGAACTLCSTFSPTDDRLLIGVRGDTSLTFVDVTSRSADLPPLLKCVGDPPEARDNFAACDDVHRIIRAPSGLAVLAPNEQPTEIPLPDEPYALAVDDASGLLYVGHLSGNTGRPYSGGFSLFDVAPRGAGPLAAPRFIAPFSSPFTPTSLGSVGVSALKQTNGYVYAASRFAPQVARLGSTATCPLDETGVREIVAYPDGVFYNSPLVGSETRGIEFLVSDPHRSFVLQRTPPALIAFYDTNATDVLETCGSPTFLSQYGDGAATRLFVTCPADGEIYVYDPFVPLLVKTFPVGRGPAGLVFDKDRRVAYVVGFGDNNISVVDLVPGSTTEYHVVQRIGFPRTSPR